MVPPRSLLQVCPPACPACPARLACQPSLTGQNLAAPDTRSLTHPPAPANPRTTPRPLCLSHHHDTTPPPAPPSPAHNLNPCTRLAEPTIHAFFSTTTRRWIPPSAFFPSRLRHPPPSLVLPAHPRGSSPQLPTRQDLPPWAKPSRSPLSKRCVHALPRAPACAGSSLADYATAPDRASPPRPACLPACLPACPPRSLVQASSRPLSPFLSFPTTPGDEGLRVMARRTALARSPRPSARIARPLLERVPRFLPIVDPVQKMLTSPPAADIRQGRG